MRWQSGSLRGVEICAGLVDSGVESSTDGIDEPPAVIKRHSGHVTLHSAVWALCWTMLARWAGDGGGDDDDDDRDEDDDARSGDALAGERCLLWLRLRLRLSGERTATSDVSGIVEGLL